MFGRFLHRQTDSRPITGDIVLANDRTASRSRGEPSRLNVDRNQSPWIRFTRKLSPGQDDNSLRERLRFRRVRACKKTLGDSEEHDSHGNLSQTMQGNKPWLISKTLNRTSAAEMRSVSFTMSMRRPEHSLHSMDSNEPALRRDQRFRDHCETF